MFSSVLMSIFGYWMNVFPITKKVIAKIESVCRNFLWSAKAEGRKSLVAWNNICEPWNAGGLNFKNLHSWNKALILKLLWNIHSKANKLWIRWLDTYFMKGNHVLQWQITQISSWMLNAILKCRSLTQNCSAWDKGDQIGKYHTATIYRENHGDRTKVP